MRLMPDDEPVYVECDTCCWGCSGESMRVDVKADAHEFENPGHVVEECQT